MNFKNVSPLLAGITIIFISSVIPLTACNITTTTETEVIKIGAVGHLAHDSGKLILYGCTIAADEINSSGGINIGGVKQQVKIVQVDSNELSGTTYAVAAVEKAITIDKVNCLIGSYRLDSALAEQDKAMGNKVIFIGSGNSDPEINTRVKKDYSTYKYWFRTNLNAVYSALYLNSHAEFIGNILKNELSIQELKAAIIADRSTPFNPIVGTLTKSLPEIGIKVSEIYRPLPSSTDLSNEIQEIKDSGAHIAIQILTGISGYTFARQWGELQLPCAPIGINIAVQSKTIWDTLNTKVTYLCTGTLCPNAEITPKTLSLVNKFSEKYNHYPEHGATSYDAVWIYKEAIEKAGTLNADALVTTLEKTDYTGATYRIVFGDINSPFPHDVLSKQVKGYAVTPLVQWIGNEQVCVWPPEVKGARTYQIPPSMVKFYSK